jgi:methylase of polypeptide subunit release factors
MPPSERPAPTARDLSKEDEHLLWLGRFLLAEEYQFTTVTPDTHRRVLLRRREAKSLRDVFGWNLPFSINALAPAAMHHLSCAGALERQGDLVRSAVRASTLGGQLFLHSAFPTTDTDAVFFGPDTYRFARWLSECAQRVDGRAIKHIADIGAGSGAGGLVLRHILGDGPEIILTDINAKARRFGRINAAINGGDNIEVIEADVLHGQRRDFDLIVSNPPYLVDAGKRLYRHGGGDLGFDLSLRIASEGVQHLKPGGHLLLYSGSAIVEGQDGLLAALEPLQTDRSLTFHYEEIDPDVFAEELETPAYHCADRIAVVALHIIKSSKVNGDDQAR